MPEKKAFECAIPIFDWGELHSKEVTVGVFRDGNIEVVMLADCGGRFYLVHAREVEDAQGDHE